MFSGNKPPAVSVLRASNLERYDTEICGVARRLSPSDYVTFKFGETVKWLVFCSKRASIPDCGWKIHVSSCLVDASELLTTIVPYLISQFVTFKLPSSSADFLTVNRGAGGIGGIGKILTAYPTNSRECRRHIHWLGARWKPAKAPVIESDFRPFADSAVFFRYGPFTAPSVKPLAVEEGHSLIAAIPTRKPLKARNKKQNDGRIKVGETGFWKISAVRSRAKGSVFWALSDSLEFAYLKVARTGADEDEYGVDASHRLCREIEFLGAALKAGVSCPRILDSSTAGDAAVALEEISGKHLNKSGVATPLVVSKILREVSKLHRVGILHRDLKPSNILVAEDRTFLIDFEYACYGDERRAPLFWSDVYTSEEGRRGSRPTRGHDVYSVAIIVIELLARTTIGDRLQIARALDLLDGSVAKPFTKMLRSIIDLQGRDGHDMGEFAAAFQDAFPETQRGDRGRHGL